MSFIGIITNQKHFDKLKKYMGKDFKSLRADIICINNNSIENMKNIKFDVVIIYEISKKIKEKEEYIREIIKNAKYLILNADIKTELEIFAGINVQTITYGLKQKSTITASSISEDEIIICIQRAFKNMQCKVIDNQEIKEKLEKNNTENIYNSLIKTGIINIYSD